jgi:hypothetical protein
MLGELCRYIEPFDRLADLHPETVERRHWVGRSTGI